MPSPALLTCYSGMTGGEGRGGEGMGGMCVTCALFLSMWLSAHFICRRFELKDIPTDTEEETKQWLIKLYQEKVSAADCV